MSKVSLFRPGVGVILLNEQDQIFVGQRYDASVEAWQMPQGGIDPGETPEQALFRELLEETGLRASLVELERALPGWFSYYLPEDLQGVLWGGRFVGQRQKWFVLRFLGQDSDITIETADPEFKNWRWAAREDLVEMIVDFKKPLYQEILMHL